jgi:hypothetical protein
MSAIDFNALLGAQAFEAKPPEPIPQGKYPCVIKQLKPQVRKTKEKGDTPVITIEVRLTGWPEEVSEEAKGDTKIEVKTFSRDYWLNGEEIAAGNTDSFFQLDELMRSCGIDASGRNYKESLPDLIGAECWATIRQRSYENKEHKMVETTEMSGLRGMAGEG